jgi:hypothetical protein
VVVVVAAAAAQVDSVKEGGVLELGEEGLVNRWTLR